MAKFILEIELGNDLMSEACDVSDALTVIAMRIEDGAFNIGAITDGNGNTVGKYEVIQ